MAQLEELLHSLTAVIIQYNDYQTTSTIKYPNANELSQFIQNADFNDELLIIIEKATKKYSDRKSFLMYLAHEINFIKLMLKKEQPFSAEELTQNIQQIAQLFKDFTQLLTAPKSKTYKVTYSAMNGEESKNISLPGLQHGSYFTSFVDGAFCVSGKLVNQLLEQVNISPDSSDKQINSLARLLCLEHQNRLQTSELQQAYARIKKLEQERDEAVHSSAAQIEAKLTEPVIKHSLEVLREANKAKSSVEATPVAIAELAKTKRTVAQIPGKIPGHFLNPATMGLYSTWCLFSEAKKCSQNPAPTSVSQASQTPIP